MGDKEGTMIIRDKDIATIEAMHDLLLDHGRKLNETALKEARDLTDRMYESLGFKFSNKKLYGDNNE